jgi:hypothetical protein
MAIALTNDDGARTFLPPLFLLMKALQRMLAVVGICMVLFSSIAVRVDDPETSYDESEAPINSAALVVTNIAAQPNPLVQAGSAPAVVRPEGAGSHKNSTGSASALRQGIGNSRSRLKLLCTLIC